MTKISKMHGEAVPLELQIRINYTTVFSPLIANVFLEDPFEYKSFEIYMEDKENTMARDETVSLIEAQ